MAEPLRVILLCTGIVLALLAVVVVSPDAPRELRRWIGVWFRGVWSRLLFWRRPVSARVDVAAAAISMGGGAVAVTVTNRDRGGSPEQQIRALHDDVDRLDRRVDAIAPKLLELDAVDRRLSDELAAIRADAEGLRSAIEDVEHKSTKLDARGLIPTVVGIVLGGASTELAELPVVGVVCAIIGIALVVVCLAMLRADRQERARTATAAAAAAATATG